jgi:hypothetical protein
MMCENLPPEGWILPGESADCPLARIALPLVFELAGALQERDEAGRELADRALALLQEHVIVFREGAVPPDGEPPGGHPRSSIG